MSSVNKAILVGNLGKDPELKDVNGSALCKFSIATTEVWRDKSGEKMEKTEWHNIVVWGKQADACAKFLQKGRSVYVEGSIQTRSWDGDDGQKRYMTEIKAAKVVFLGGKQDGGQRYGQGARPASKCLDPDDLAKARTSSTKQTSWGAQNEQGPPAQRGLGDNPVSPDNDDIPF